MNKVIIIKVKSDKLDYKNFKLAYQKALLRKNGKPGIRGKKL